MNKSESKYFHTAARMDVAFLGLLEKKDIQYITVKEICEAAGVNRSTFYLHYTDIYTMLETIENDLICQVQTAIQEYPLDPVHKDSSYPFISRMFAILDENRDICASLLGPNGDMNFVSRVEILLADTVLEKLKEEFPKNIHDIRYAYAYCIHGCMGIVKTWLSDPQPGSPEHVADLTAQFITDTAHAYLHKMEQL